MRRSEKHFWAFTYLTGHDCATGFVYSINSGIIVFAGILYKLATGLDLKDNARNSEDLPLPPSPWPGGGSPPLPGRGRAAARGSNGESAGSASR